MISLKKQVAVVTGASSGIGKSIALELAKQEVVLCLLGRDLSSLEKVARIAKQSTHHVHCYNVDITIDQEVADFSKSVSAEFNAVDILVHSAGAIFLESLESAAVENFDRQYNTNVRGPYLLTQCLLPFLKSRQGQIVFINSSATFNTPPRLSQYAATKHALRAVADSLRQEVNADGIRILSVYPGRTASPMQASVFRAEGKVYDPEILMQPTDLAMMVIAALQLPKSAEVTDIHMRPMKKPV
jgi:NADP-dependent 3-hydroxy acid dehydrogenase YdfG